MYTMMSSRKERNIAITTRQAFYFLYSGKRLGMILKGSFSLFFIIFVLETGIFSVETGNFMFEIAALKNNNNESLVLYTIGL